MPGAWQAPAQPRLTPAQHKLAILGKTKASWGRGALVSPWWESGPCRTSVMGSGGGVLPPGAANQISSVQPRGPEFVFYVPKASSPCEYFVCMVFHFLAVLDNLPSAYSLK